MSALLELNDVTVQFGGLKAVSELTFSIGDHELVGLIGPNGAGKTTVFNLITGVYRPTSGKISFAGKVVGGQQAYKITARGIARTFQIFVSLAR
jgi:branched-chain amino acid transport system ATP-binding protein